MGRLDGKVAIVTGGGKGLGKSITQALCAEGAKVTITGRHFDALEATANEFKAQGYDVLPVQCDGGVREQVKNVVTKTVETFGKLNILVNNAHVSTQSPLEKLTDDEMALSLNAGIWAVFYYMQECFPYLKECGNGKIVNFGSAAAIKGQPLQATYAAAKEGVRGMSRVAVNEWGPYGICVNIVCPLAESPGMLDWKERLPEAYNKVIEGVPLRRLGKPLEDIGRTVAFLASDDADFVTGNTIHVDGGGATRP